MRGYLYTYLCMYINAYIIYTCIIGETHARGPASPMRYAYANEIPERNRQVHNHVQAGLTRTARDERLTRFRPRARRAAATLR